MLFDNCPIDANHDNCSLDLQLLFSAMVDPTEELPLSHSVDLKHFVLSGAQMTYKTYGNMKPDCILIDEAQDLNLASTLCVCARYGSLHRTKVVLSFL